MSAWSAGASHRGKSWNHELGATSTSTEAQLETTDDVLDEEVVLLSDAVVRLKGMAKQIGEESRETGKVQEAVARQMEAAQVAMTAGVRKMKRLHREMTSSCGHMLVLAIYAVVLVLGVVFLTKVKAFLGWVLKWVLWWR